MLKNLRDLLGVVAGYCRLESAIVEELEDQNKDIYALKEKDKLNSAAIKDLIQRVGKLELEVGRKVSL